jgi:nucleotide-binding universal stress UspA family protein
MKRFRKILVAAPVDRTADTAGWVDLVVRSASTLEVDWRVLVEPPLALPGEPGGEWLAADEAEPAAGELRGRDWPEHLELQIAAIAHPHDTQVLQALGRHDYDLVVVACLPSGFRPLSEKLCRKAPCSVLVIPPGADSRPAGIQVATDFSDFSKEALEISAAFARGLSLADPRVIHAWSLPESQLRAALPYEQLRPLIEAAANKRLSSFVADNAPDDLAWTTELIEAPLACTAILNASRERPSDLLVISHRGGNALAEALLGSTAAEVVRRVECPCLVVKRKGAGLRLLRDLLGFPDAGEDD